MFACLQQMTKVTARKELQADVAKELFLYFVHVVCLSFFPFDMLAHVFDFKSDMANELFPLLNTVKSLYNAMFMVHTNRPRYHDILKG